MLFENFLANRSGAFGMVFALLLVPILLGVGVSVDYVFAFNAREKLQAATDSAVLAAATSYEDTTPLSDTTSMINAYLAANGDGNGELVGDPTFSSNNSQLCAVSKADISTSFMQIANIYSIPVRVESCAGIPGYVTSEIALVLDVSSSMIEQSRFTPMQSAVKGFLSAFSSGTAASRVRISIVPFSSRFNIGMTNTGWLRAYGGNAAVPTRWTKPSSVYSSSSYTLTTWIDDVTPLAYTSKNYYWMGCIEPRSDVEVKDGGKVGTYGLTDDPPSASAFVAQDWNSQSSKSFCPPPITPLTNDFDTLSDAIDNMTSEGSTRLDAGMIAGWYTLSPKWQSSWDEDSKPADYSNLIQKVVVFMTDGQMNTQYGTSSSKLDWRCYMMQSSSTSSACNDAATDDMLTICTAMKNQGIKIYTVAYSSDAEVANLRSCSSGDDYSFSASASTSSTSYIGNIYDAIAEDIRSGSVRLTY